MNKVWITNLLALSVVILSYSVAFKGAEMLRLMGLFALSGAVTNQLAIHMLFERVPFLYGSGIIERNFTHFKRAIHEMVMREFFSPSQLESFIQAYPLELKLEPIIQKTDFSPAFDALSKTVMQSKFGGAISMFGGEEALEGLREPFVKKLQESILLLVQSKDFQENLEKGVRENLSVEHFSESLERLIGQHLETLTPQMVKALVEELIHEHLGWLVVWGGVLGALMGAFSFYFI